MKQKLAFTGPYLVFFAALLWASDAPFRVHLTESLSSEIIVLLEHTIALIVLAPFLYKYRNEIKALTIKEWTSVFFIGIGGSALALLLFTKSFSYMNPSIVILLQKLQPLIAISLAIIYLKEITPRKFYLWSGVALIGAYIISFPTLIPQLYEGEVFNPHIIGALLALSAAVLWGASTVFGKYMLSSVSFQTITSLRFAIAFIFLLIYNAISGSLSEINTMQSTDWLFIGIISITSGAVAMYIYYRGLSNSPASVATIAELGFPMGAVVINYFFLDATLLPMQLFGMSLLLLAIYYLGKINKT